MLRTTASRAEMQVDSKCGHAASVRAGPFSSFDGKRRTDTCVAVPLLHLPRQVRLEPRAQGSTMLPNVLSYRTFGRAGHEVAGVHRSTRQRGGVPVGGAGAAADDAGDRISWHLIA